MRPQATHFSDSARNRDSVMSLGTISHLQYYFARTGLLDGKGAQLAKNRKSSAAAGSGTLDDVRDSLRSLSMSSDNEIGTDTVDGALVMDDAHSTMMESPIDTESDPTMWEPQDTVMLPPTVSTYKYKPTYVAPPPDMNVLRRELREALDDVDKVLKETAKGQPELARESDGDDTADQSATTKTQGFYEIEGMHLLDIVTLAIRAAKNYYTAHEQPQRLYTLKSERAIRSELYQVLEVLKRLATRNFAGGIRRAEHSSIQTWTTGIYELLHTEEATEKREQEEQALWSWRRGDWNGREREREWLFLRSFDISPDPLPPWEEPSAQAGSQPNLFLHELQNGVRLVELHNELVRKSRKQFGEIKAFHTDTAKPYRRAENLRFWAKAAQLRWEVTLDLDVMGVVHGTDDAAWLKFDRALLKWCKTVREELVRDWEEHRRAAEARPPTLRIDEGEQLVESIVV